MHETHDALIFDCDGVLVNSEQIAQEVERAQLAAVGMDYAHDEFARRFTGTSERDYREAIMRDAADRFAVELPHTFFDDMNAAIGAAYEQRLETIDGAGRLAAAWPRLRAVASSSALEPLRFKLRKTRLAHLFGDHVYSADLVHAGKPDPAVFLLAAERLKVAPARCLVVEDSVNGVLAAKRAGMTALGFTGGRHCLPDQLEQLHRAGADAVFGSHAAIAAHLALAW